MDVLDYPEYGETFPLTIKLKIGIWREFLIKFLKNLLRKNRTGTRASYKVGDFHPYKGMLARYGELGGEIIAIRYDAHRAEDIAKDFEEARELKKSLAFTHFCAFSQRKNLNFIN